MDRSNATAQPQRCPDRTRRRRLQAVSGGSQLLWAPTVCLGHPVIKRGPVTYYLLLGVIQGGFRAFWIVDVRDLEKCRAGLVKLGHGFHG
jgi:hypothetical protein